MVEAGEAATADLKLMKEGVEITLKVYFDVDQATIRPESKDGLAAAAKIMNDNPGIKVEIVGHTDNTGSEEYNLALSRRRAQAVVDYLVTQLGVDRSLLTAKGYGEAKPVATNDTDEGRQLNRRVEFKVLEK
jgi:OOP family OmpA-OmpF porin